jgi:coenzyme F420-reducing hydrogenase gamma subunit
MRQIRVRYRQDGRCLPDLLLVVPAHTRFIPISRVLAANMTRERECSLQTAVVEVAPILGTATRGGTCGQRTPSNRIAASGCVTTSLGSPQTIGAI